MGAATPSRRAVLRIAGAGAVVAGIAVVWPWRETPTGVAGPVSGAAFGEPSVLRSSGGVLDVDLVASGRTVPWRDGRRYVLVYNGAVPGPTIRV